MTVSFNPAAPGPIVVEAHLYGPTGDVVVRLALDTGSRGTVIDAKTLIGIGIDPAATGKPQPVTTAGNVVTMIQVPVSVLTALGESRTNFSVLAHTFPPTASTDGLLGRNFLLGHVLTIDFVKGEISLTVPGPTP
jgi:hypothetical protein